MFKSKKTTTKKLMYSPVNPNFTPQFYFIKVGLKGIYITRTCSHDADANLKRKHQLYNASRIHRLVKGTFSWLDTTTTKSFVQYVFITSITLIVCF